MKKIRNFIHWLLLKYAYKNWPLSVTTKTLIYHKVYVKKGKIREWRIFNEDGVRIYNGLI